MKDIKLYLIGAGIYGGGSDTGSLAEQITTDPYDGSNLFPKKQQITAPTKSSGILGAGLSGITGIGQLIAGAIENKKAKNEMPPEVDPAQADMLDTLRRIRLGYSSGSEAQQYKGTINTGLNSILNKIGATSGGDTGAALAATSLAQDNAMNAYNNVASTLEKNRLGLLGMETKATDDIAQRKLDIQQERYLQDKAEGEGNLKSGQQNILSGISQIGAGTGGGLGGIIGGLL